MGFSAIGFNEYIDEMLEKKEKEDDQALERQDKLFALSLQYEGNKSKSRTSDKYLKAVNSSMNLRKNLLNSELTTEDLEFFKPILEDPFAASFVEDFIAERAKQGLTITYSMIPNMMNIITSNAPQQEKIDFMERITGTDFSGKEGRDNYEKIAREIVSAPTEIQQTLFVNPKPGMNINIKNRDAYNKEMVKKVETQVMPLATLMRDNLLSKKTAGTLTEQENRDLINLQSNVLKVKEGGIGSDVALQRLIQTVGYTKESFDQLTERYPMDFVGWEGNPFLSSLPNLFPDLD